MMTTHPNALIASDYVICVNLRAVPDIFNAEWLWDRVRIGQEGVLLLEALKRHPRRIARSAGQRQETYYSHVVIRISERDSIRDERLEDGFGRHLLLRELRRLHERDLGEHLAENATIRYRLEPDPMLRPGEVQALFGRAIHLPADDEAPVFRIEVTADGQSDWREVGSIYPGQRLTLLNGDRRASSYAVVAWPFPGNESILLLQRSEAPTLVDVVEEPPACLNLTGDGQGGFVARDHRGRGLRLRVVALSADVELLNLAGTGVARIAGAAGTAAHRPGRRFGQAGIGIEAIRPGGRRLYDDRSLGPARAGVRHPNTFRGTVRAAGRHSGVFPATRARSAGRTRPAHLDSPSTGGLLAGDGRRLATLVDLCGGRYQRLADQLQPRGRTGAG
jgi:hypothetical protein